MEFPKEIMGKQHAPAELSVPLFGELTPYSDPNWYQGWNSPYYNEGHLEWRRNAREFCETQVNPYVHEWDEAKKMPMDFFRKAYQAGILPAIAGSPWPEEFVPKAELMDKFGVIVPEDYDCFHELIVMDELCRCGSGGVIWGIAGGLGIGLPPVMKFGGEHVKKKCVADCLRGEKVICLAITEPMAGSDVANLGTTAEKTEDGTHYIVNGEKKWITNGVFADFFTTAVRTGGKGMGGLSLLLMEKGAEGLETNQMQCMGVWPSGTTYITFDDVKVPCDNIIGEENKGFKYIMYNFNHERWQLIAQTVRFARVCIEDSWKYAHKRKTFGKRLIEHPVIRWKFAEMARQVESLWAMLEQVTYQMCTMGKEEQNLKLGGTTALLKAHATKIFEYCAREAAQIFGGASYVRGGQGVRIERLYREVRAMAIPGGSEEIMLDLGIKQSMKMYQLTRGVAEETSKYTKA